jgi:hypothetical protein
MHQDPFDFATQEELAQVEAITKDLDILAAHQAQETLQASWISDGIEHCSKRFSLILRQRCAANNIQGLTILDGLRVEGPSRFCRWSQIIKTITLMIIRLEPVPLSWQVGTIYCHLSQIASPLVSSLSWTKTSQSLRS